MKVVNELRVVPAAAESSGQLQDQIASHLRQRIRDGSLPPGGRVLEAQVAKSFGVSRSPARRALEILSAEHLLHEHPTRGYLVAGSPVHEEGGLARIEPVKLSQARQWELMYSEVEQSLFAAVLFESVWINDQRLAEHFGVSRTVTRDLLGRMHGLGLISKDKVGHWIGEQVTPERIGHLFEMRKLLEPYLLREAAGHVGEGTLLSAKEHILASLSRHPVDSADFDRAETDLHVTILNQAPNKEILRALNRTHLLFGPTRYLLDPILGIPTELIEDALHEHLQIIDLLLGKEGEKAASRLHDHIEAAIDRWLRRFEITRRAPGPMLPPYLTPLRNA